MQIALIYRNNVLLSLKIFIADRETELSDTCNSIHEFASELLLIAGVKLLLLCDLFTKHKAELSREERHEIIRYAKSRLPIFMSQLHRLLQGVKSTFSSMSPSQRQEVATYLVPEVSSKYT